MLLGKVFIGCSGTSSSFRGDEVILRISWLVLGGVSPLLAAGKDGCVVVEEVVSSPFEVGDNSSEGKGVVEVVERGFELVTRGFVGRLSCGLKVVTSFGVLVETSLFCGVVEGNGLVGN